MSNKTIVKDIPDIFRQGMANGWVTYNGATLEQPLHLDCDVLVIGTSHSMLLPHLSELSSCGEAAERHEKLRGVCEASRVLRVAYRAVGGAREAWGGARERSLEMASRLGARCYIAVNIG